MTLHVLNVIPMAYRTGHLNNKLILPTGMSSLKDMSILCITSKEAAFVAFDQK